jgi:hypothetical protein
VEQFLHDQRRQQFSEFLEKEQVADFHRIDQTLNTFYKFFIVLYFHLAVFKEYDMD